MAATVGGVGEDGSMAEGAEHAELSPQVVIVGPDGMAVGGGSEEREPSITDMVEQPAKVMRIGSMIKQLLEEVRAAVRPTPPFPSRRLTETAAGHAASWLLS